MSQEANKSTAISILKKLRKAGYQSLFAGGCVRDMLLGSRPHDYDIATDATPDQVAAIFRRTIMVGAQFGVAMVMQKDHMCEVATFRNDDSYSDGRRPDSVTFSTPKEDALRRDFTINGMFFDPIENKVIDFVGGQTDLKKNIIRTIGNPCQRFAEDHLRIMRAIRFATRLNFEIEPQTFNAIKKFAPKIVEISGERIFDELNKMFTKDSAHIAFAQLEKTKIAQKILPELFENKNQFDIALKLLSAVSKFKKPILNFGAILFYLNKKQIKKIIRRWGQSNNLLRSLIYFVENNNRWENAASIELCDFKRLISNSDWELLRKLFRSAEFLETYKNTQSIRIAKRVNKIDPKLISPKLFVTGEDLKQLGLTEGRKLGAILRKLTDSQLNEELTSRAQALKLAKKLVAELN